MKNEVEYIAYSPKLPKSHSVDEIVKSGGATAFANKLGKNPKDLIVKLSSLPAESFLTDEELNSALTILNADK